MRQIKLFLSLLILSGCGGDRPSVSLYEVRGKAIPPYCNVTDPDGNQKHITIQECDKVLGLNPKNGEFGKAQQYLLNLEADNAKLKKENAELKANCH